jgi:hypothetical protein
MFTPTISKNVVFGEVGAPIANASNTDSNSDRLDMAGHEGVWFFCPIEDSASTGVATLKVEQNTADSDSGMAAIAGASHSVTCAVNDDLNGKLLSVEVYRPRERYVQAVRTSATANIAFGTLIAIRYGERKLPVTPDTTVLTGGPVVVTSPAEA